MVVVGCGACGPLTSLEVWLRESRPRVQADDTREGLAGGLRRRVRCA